jgi:type IV pilus assembly protein PilO
MAIDFDDLKKLSPKYRWLIIGGIYVVLGYFYFLLSFDADLTKKMTLDTKITELQRQVVEKERTVAKIEQYIREIAGLQAALKIALEKLPNAREIPDLVAAVATSGRETGMDFLIFEPKPPERKPPETKPATPPAPPPKPADAKGQPAKPAVPEKFYEEIPIKVQVSGGFHNTLSFFERVARLPRIVNIEDIAMSDSQVAKGRGRVVKTSCTVKTYMFVDKVDKVDKK